MTILVFVAMDMLGYAFNRVFRDSEFDIIETVRRRTLFTRSTFDFCRRLQMSCRSSFDNSSSNVR